MGGKLLCSRYDAALFDLDGVIYLGPRAVEGAPEGIDGLRAEGVKVGFVTNNAARAPQAVADHLTRIGVDCDPADVVTSAQASARMLAEALPVGARVLISGTTALAAEVEAAGLRPVWSSKDGPAAVIQGYDPDMTWPRVTDAAHAVQAGARWFATNPDMTRPTDLGIEPGLGTQIAALGVCLEPGSEPEMAGKPFPPLLRETVRRLSAEHPIFVGDRLDTDVEGACNVDMDSLFVFTGAHGMRDLFAAGARWRPTHLGYDIRALLRPARNAEIDGDSARCGAAVATITGGRVRTGGVKADPEDQLDALWAALRLAWRDADRGAEIDATAVVETLDLLH
ncbi:HAD-IIA family hydrolase [uncultured Propionibacterium sp.]|uniref:HAD-IIA family hydrolase n=1 Tax=uncultured Propionibacterium sp. TaxID=218066 RepID=UPI00292E125C|nr:HAD-IIA family hydrolase [uncultured Propionibacterium sp.]